MKTIKKITAVLMALIMTMMALAACGSQSSGGGEEAASDAGYPMTFDNYGHELTLDKMPEKVITAGPNCTELFIALGLEDKIIGNSCDNHAQAPLDEYKEAYDKVPELTFGYPTLEAVVSSGADFLYAIDWVFEGDFTIEALEENGVKVYSNSASTVDDVYQEIRDMGKIFDVSDKAEAFIADQQSRIDAATKAIEGQDTLKVFCYDCDTGDGIYTAGGPNLETELIALAGGDNLMKGLDKAWTGVSLEEILEANPDVIVIHDYDTPTADEKIAAIKSDPILSQLQCVKDERFVVLPLEDAFPGSRTADAVETLAKGFFPDCF
jgi:iron complex transport system substrate-binding protein